MTEIESLIDRLRCERLMDRVVLRNPAPDGEVAAVESRLQFHFPSSYRSLLTALGSFDLASDALFDVSSNSGRSIEEVLAKTRAACPSLPKSLIPFAESSNWIGPMKWGKSYVCFDRRRTLNDEALITRWTPEAKPKDRLEREDQTFSEWLAEIVEDEERYPHPPRDWRNNEGWERYWKRIIEDPDRVRWETASGGEALTDNRAFLRERRYRKVLFAGNGISLAPYAFSHAGFEVTVLDVSQSAVSYVRAHPLQRSELTRYYAELADHDEVKVDGSIKTMKLNQARSRERVKREAVPGGKVLFKVADLFEFEPERPFDVICSARSFQGFEDADRCDLASRFFRWLSPGGLCVLHAHNTIGDAANRIEEPFHGAGFFVGGERSGKWIRAYYRRRVRPRRCWEDPVYLRLVDDEAAEERARLDSGAKMVSFYFSSG